MGFGIWGFGIWCCRLSRNLVEPWVRLTMCYFVTVGMPKSGDADFKAAVPRGMAAHATHNRSIMQHLGENYTAYLLTSGMCSCELFGPYEEEEPPENREKTSRQANSRYTWDQPFRLPYSGRIRLGSKKTRSFGSRPAIETNAVNTD